MTSRSGASVLLALGFLVCALHGLGSVDIVGDDEAREAGIVQDILAGHWLLPRFNAELLPDKPVLYHWLAALACMPAGFSETAVRLPSALAGAALVGYTAQLGTFLFGGAAGLTAGLVLATTPAFFDRARTARPDVLLVLLLSVALGFAFRAWRDGRRRDATAAWAVLGASVLAKGPVGPVLFAVTMGGFLSWQGTLRDARRLVTPLGVLLFLALGLGWYALALAGWGERFVDEHLVGRYLRNLAGGLLVGGTYSPRPLTYHLFFYVKHLPAVALPWTPFTIAAIVTAWRRPEGLEPVTRFLICWALASVVAFTPAEWKLRYYLLPSLPALALLTGPFLHALRPAPRTTPARWAAWLVPVVATGTVAAVLVGVRDLAWLSRSDRSLVDAALQAVPGGAPIVAMLVGLGAAGLTAAVARRAWSEIAVATATLTVAWLWLVIPAVEHSIAARDSLRGFAERIATRLPAGAPLAFYEASIRPVVVYARRSVPVVTTRGNELSPGLALIIREPAYRRLAESGLVGEPLLSAEGRIDNLARGTVVLTLVTPAFARVPSQTP